MGLVFYVPGKHTAANRLLKAVNGVAPPGERTIYTTFEMFSAYVSENFRNNNVFILMAINREELLKIISLREYLIDIPIILILPDADMSTVKKGHALYPRFLSYMDSDFTDVAAVLNKMIQLYRL